MWRSYIAGPTSHWMLLSGELAPFPTISSTQEIGPYALPRLGEAGPGVRITQLQGHEYGKAQPATQLP